MPPPAPIKVRCPIAALHGYMWLVGGVYGLEALMRLGKFLGVFPPDAGVDDVLVTLAENNGVTDCWLFDGEQASNLKQLPRLVSEAQRAAYRPDGFLHNKQSNRPSASWLSCSGSSGGFPASNTIKSGVLAKGEHSERVFTNADDVHWRGAKVALAASSVRRVAEQLRSQRGTDSAGASFRRRRPSGARVRDAWPTGPSWTSPTRSTRPAPARTSSSAAWC